MLIRKGCYFLLVSLTIKKIMYFFNCKREQVSRRVNYVEDFFFVNFVF